MNLNIYNNSCPLLTEKYRPQTIDECILPDYLKATFKGMVVAGNVSNMTLAGSPGIGKTAVARAVLNEIGADYIVINASMDGNIETLRNTVKDFASTVSFTKARKFVILDEADAITRAAQEGLRSFMEEYASNCGFILTCNNHNKILDALLSRCPVIEFKIAKSDKPKYAMMFFKRLEEILDTEGYTVKKPVLAEIVQKFFPDFRRTINEIQIYGNTNNKVIDEGILASRVEKTIKELIGFLKIKNFSEVRKWVHENTDADSASFFRALFDNSNQYISQQSIPQLILILGEYQYKQAFVADSEINMLACLIEIMADCEFKE